MIKDSHLFLTSELFFQSILFLFQTNTPTRHTTSTTPQHTAMMTRTIALILTLTLATLANSKCPNIQPVEGLSLTNWTQSTWYIAQQQLNGYQKKEDLYCTLATYDLNRSQHIPFFKGDVVSVHNYQNVNERDRCQW